MVYVDAMQPQMNAFPCEVGPGEGTGTISLRLPNGKYLGLDIFTGAWTQTDAVGAWESWKRGANALVMDVTWDGSRRTYIRPFVEIR